MKTKNNPRFMANLKLFLVLPAILLVLIAFSSCAAKKKVATVQTVSKEKLPQYIQKLLRHRHRLHHHLLRIPGILQ
jgi:hypothetical protein